MADRNDLKIVGDELIVVPRGLDKLWGFRKRIVVALGDIAAVEVEQRPLRVATGWRGPGLDAGVKRSGSFHLAGELTYWNVSGMGPALLIQVRGGAPFDRLYLSFADPEAARTLIAEAVEQYSDGKSPNRT